MFFEVRLQGWIPENKFVQVGSFWLRQHFFLIFVVQALIMHSEQHLVQKCLLTIEEKLSWGPSKEWHNDMFVELSERIQEQTKVLLSPVTLKRVWGRIEYNHVPSITTLNTLSRFAGFENWRDFKEKNSSSRVSGFPKKASANAGVIVLSASILTLIFISFYSLRSPEAENLIIDPSTIVFNSRPIAQGLPNSVVFDLDLGNIRSDSIHIQQYWDPTKTISLIPGQKQATGQYYLPGYFRAKLMVDGEIIKQHDLFIKSEGWMGTIDYKPVPKYLESVYINRNKLALPPETLNEIAANDDPLISTFHLVEDLEEVSGDNFELNTTIQSVFSDKWAVCQLASLMVLGTKGAIVITMGIPGCVSELSVMMNDVYLSGKEHDLSNLGIDLSEPRNVVIQVRNKELELFFDGKKHFSGRYNKSLGRVVGLRYRFLGAGEVTKTSLYDIITDEAIIDEEFTP